METTQAISILLLDNDPDHIQSVTTSLQEAVGVSFTVTQVSNMEGALRLLKSKSFSAALLRDYLLDAWSDCEVIRQSAPGLSLILIRDIEQAIFSTLPPGSVDAHLHIGLYNPATLVQTICNSIQKRESVVAETKFLTTDPKRILFDAITQLPALTLLEDRLDQTIKLNWYQKDPFAILAIQIQQLDAFKQQHPTTHLNRLLQDFGERINANVHGPNTVGHLGNGKFIVILNHVRKPIDAVKTAHLLQRLIEQPFLYDGDFEIESVHIHANIGVAIYPSDGDNAALLIDKALSASPENADISSGTVSACQPQLNTTIKAILNTETQLRQAWNKGEFSVGYTPILSLVDKKLSGVQTSLVWEHPQRGILSDTTFLKIAKETGLLVPLEDWFFRVIRKRYEALLSQGLNPTIPLHIPVSEHLFLRPDFLSKIDDHLANPSKNWFILEIPAEIICTHFEQSKEILDTLSSKNISLAFSGYGEKSLAPGLLCEFSANIWKLSPHFSYLLENQPALAQGLLAFAHYMEKQIMATGVANADLLKQYGMLGCVSAQGEHIGKISCKEFSAALR